MQRRRRFSFVLDSGPEKNKIVNIIFALWIAVGNHIKLRHWNPAVLREEKPFVAEIGQISEYLAIGIAAGVPVFALEEQCRLIPAQNSCGALENSPLLSFH